MNSENLGNVNSNFINSVNHSININTDLRAIENTKEVASLIFDSFDMGINDTFNFEELNFSIENFEECFQEREEGIEKNREGSLQTIEGAQEEAQVEEELELKLEEEEEASNEKEEISQNKSFLTDKKVEVNQEKEKTDQEEKKGNIEKIASKIQEREAELIKEISHYETKAYHISKSLAKEALHEAKIPLAHVRHVVGDLRTANWDQPISDIKRPHFGHGANRVQFKLSDIPGHGFIVVPRKSGRKAGVEFERDGIRWKIIFETKEEEAAFLNAWYNFLNALKAVNREKKDESEEPKILQPVIQPRSEAEPLEEVVSAKQHNPLAKDIAFNNIKDERRMERAKDKRANQKREVDKEESQKELRAKFIRQRNLIHDNIARSERLQDENSEILNKQSLLEMGSHKFVKAY